MVSFCIDNNILGTKQHLLVDNGFSWIDNVPDSVWYLNGKLKNTEWCLDTLVKLNGLTIDIMPPQKYYESMMTLMSGSSAWPPPWQSVMPRAEHRRFVESLIASVNSTLDRSFVDFFKNVWVPGNNVFGSLQRAFINKKKLDAHIASNEGNINALKTFEPDAYGYAQQIVYNRFGSRTGRPSISSGPNILTLKRDHRDIIESRWGQNGAIVLLDFSALEVRIILYETGKTCNNPDLYDELNKQIFKGMMPRSAVKGAVICDLYGQSKYALGKKLGISGKHLDMFIQRIRSYFQIDKLLKKIKQQFIEKGFILNHYGRMVTIDEPLDHILINSYAQSTGADVVTLGFNEILNRIKGHNVVPIFLLVDAIILDCHVDELDYVMNINEINVEGYQQPWPLKFEKVT